MEKKEPFSLDVVSVRLVEEPPLLSKTPIICPADVVALLGEHLRGLDRETICIISFRADMRPINMCFASVGSLTQTLAHPRELLKTGILSNAAYMMMVHNHPTGELFPSRYDTQITDRMVKLCDMVDIPLVDHVIVGGNNTEYFSFKEKMMMPVSGCRLETDYKKVEFNNPIVAEKEKKR